MSSHKSLLVQAVMNATDEKEAEFLVDIIARLASDSFFELSDKQLKWLHSIADDDIGFEDFMHEYELDWSD